MTPSFLFLLQRGCGDDGCGDKDDVVKGMVDKTFCLMPPFPYQEGAPDPSGPGTGPLPPGFGCQVCGQIIQRKDNYRRHLRLHFGMLPFQCPLCPRRFNTRYHLQYHLQRSSAHANAGPATLAADPQPASDAPPPAGP